MIINNTKIIQIPSVNGDNKPDNKTSLNSFDEYKESDKQAFKIKSHSSSNKQRKMIKEFYLPPQISASPPSKPITALK